MNLISVLIYYGSFPSVKTAVINLAKYFFLFLKIDKVNILLGVFTIDYFMKQ